MTIEYYLSIRNKYKHIINHLQEVIDYYESIFSDCVHLDMDEGEQFLDLFNPRYEIEQYKYKLNITKILKNRCDQKIKHICNHEFVSDLIDISPDESKEITFCVICEHTI